MPVKIIELEAENIKARQGRSDRTGTQRPDHYRRR